MKILIFIISLLLLTSCVELIDDITIHSDGSCTFKYSINLSSSKSKVTSILALDSINGKKVPKTSEIKQKILDFKTQLSKQPGIKNVSVEYNFQDYIFKMSCDFDNVENLQTAIESTIEKITERKITNNIDWLNWSESKLERNIPDVTSDRFQNSSWVESELLKTGTYTSISRFDKPIESFSNLLSKVSISKTAIMIQVNTEEMFNNPMILKNKILLEGGK